MQSSVLTTKGQIVIPKALRDKYHLSPGTKVFFEETAAGIILKQVDAAFIKNAKGIIPKKKSDKPMAEWWPQYKAGERALEEKKFNLASEPVVAYKKAVKIKRKK
ncbi:MAG TPA: AbrB/MazE/SpoVT family DNA-binding domain-containing protein [Chitinophagaceae bacterium]|nr:AbrB/MazE/SpoVT family DNA-binding domain-containing protein [Chitinophagaceae bacterium]